MRSKDEVARSTHPLPRPGVAEGLSSIGARRRVRGKQAAAADASRCFHTPHPLSLGVAEIVGRGEGLASGSSIMHPGAPPEVPVAPRCQHAPHPLSLGVAGITGRGHSASSGSNTQLSEQHAMRCISAPHPLSPEVAEIMGKLRRCASGSGGRSELEEPMEGAVSRDARAFAVECIEPLVGVVASQARTGSTLRERGYFGSIKCRRVR